MLLLPIGAQVSELSQELEDVRLSSDVSLGPGCFFVLFKCTLHQRPLLLLPFQVSPARDPKKLNVGKQYFVADNLADRINQLQENLETLSRNMEKLEEKVGKLEKH